MLRSDELLAIMETTMPMTNENYDEQNVWELDAISYKYYYFSHSGHHLGADS